MYEKFLGPHSSKVDPTDITFVCCLRLHAKNPWVLDRLKDFKGYFDPAPKTLIIDFGSRSPYKEDIRSACEEGGFDLLHIEDYDLYSPSMAHNAAIGAVSTQFIFFMDIDFVAERDLFERLSHAATIADMRRCFDTILDLPAYHLSEDATDALMAQSTLDEKSLFLERTFFQRFFERFGGSWEFIAPYSNCFLISKSYFDLLGGYCSDFRGHGSEDFEFFIRANFYSDRFPTPPDVKDGCYRPNSEEFFYGKSYQGFRRLNETYCARAQRMNLRVYHRWHPTHQDNDPWRQKNDWKRTRMHAQIDQYLEQPQKLLDMDYLPRDKKVLCICKAEDHWKYFLPLRLEGFSLVPVYSADQAAIDKAKSLIENHEVDMLAVFNPYMKSHSGFLPLFEKAKECGVELLVIERGALPNTLYYASDVAYSLKEFSEEGLNMISLSDEQIRSTKSYLEELRSGKAALEQSQTKELTSRKYENLKSDKYKNIVFIPLQLSDDMAVRYFVRDAQKYDDFQNGIAKAAQKHTDTLFVIKPHPLSKLDLMDLPDNILAADRMDNIHALLDLADTVVCYNSGVGLLAACHQKPIITVGNAFYNISGIGIFASSIEEAMQIATDGLEPPNADAVVQLIGKYLFYRYSFFNAKDDIREFKQRKAHSYKNISVSFFTFKNRRHNLIWEKAISDVSHRSFGFSELNPSVPLSRLSENPEDLKIANARGFQIYARLYGLLLARQDREKLRYFPTAFFERAKHPLSRFGRRLFSQQ
ncbi:glycosyltransferase [uncultured Cohaesibacter sp.]|uniref:capsular polysaccharide export protein, LipB/KpsS family n=1 Tax=uncultured Cohaesibacter sp. TaxID=1002546 RepID=UPI0029C6AE9A|nr:glycosyltransferase [uncultured Cohaesibacter sp.]